MTYARFLLYPDEILRFDAHGPLTVRCEDGRLWLTAGEEGIDHALPAGGEVACPGGRILIEGEGVVRLGCAGDSGARQNALPFANLALLPGPRRPLPPTRRN